MMDTCPLCQNEIDLDVCWCGDTRLYHTVEHSFVPMGCTCGYVRQEETKPPFNNEAACQKPKDK